MPVTCCVPCSRGAGAGSTSTAPGQGPGAEAGGPYPLESLITSVGDRAAEDCLARWREHPAGAALLDRLASGGAATAAWQSEFAAEAGLIFGWDSAADGAVPPSSPATQQERIAALGRSSPDLATHAARAVSAWQDQVTHLVQAENVTKRSIAKAVTLDDDALATVLIVSLLGPSEDARGTATIPRRLLTSLFGAGPLRDIMARTRADLRAPDHADPR